MIETVASIELPVSEKIVIKKNRLCPIVETEQEKRICIVTGIHGDEVEGQYVCYELTRRIKEDLPALKGIVDIYPAVNPLGLHHNTHGIPMFELDMNRIFPGKLNGSMPDLLADRLVQDIKGAALSIDIHSGDKVLHEVPQVRLSPMYAQDLLGMAKLLNMELIWIYDNSSVVETTISNALNKLGIPNIVVEMGTSNRIHTRYGDQLVDGIFRVMKELGIWEGAVKESKEPVVVNEKTEMCSIRSDRTGIWIPRVDYWQEVKEGQLIGELIDPFSGEILSRVFAPCKGRIMSLRTYPVLKRGSLITRILEERTV